MMARFAILMFFNQKNLAISEKCRTFAAETMKQIKQTIFFLIIIEITKKQQTWLEKQKHKRWLLKSTP